ncbi:MULTISPECIES: 50S ribosomal protein L3 [Deinococcus]|jgi:LSU ribosomal protein L3P|uniref:Large ribosomal subunit protein uL3 n=3 Tax=Bacteria TaxID=2 RepID=RL3_DEIRA|nr:50S ribosomal protein L3 [Deinococcus radiodurans]Q9RXK2.1 RecName: Full=Large ribosomal subunit protein uL3; AltName: Full=50S ribosomal protein L3 [Deinococcus radiodurans R1 = ATCC 13939 = DSM 20539]1NKW_B Chain B, 50S ribosomal protein L3 [Deinococcus radiodurans]1NWX_B Chain B, ribosomal protein L3 [Deinococcus radiodurans]1NWY_B Chain B, ribosomal protein L3 [Deinococcus radiodurans]1SM1_B Chain B, 50S RIBOSOMAL PROTEIN L3 [Deinococcus radiodurans]1XBP_B Chain B, 50S ribosomal protei
MKGILGTKIGMTQIWKNDRAIPVTVVLAGPCPIVQRKTAQTDGYEAVQIGYAPKAERKVNKPMQGHFAKAGVAPTRILREFRGFAPDGDSVNVDIFAEGEKIDATGTSKGKGTQGVMKRWNFAGGPASHGSKKWHRRPGSIGQRKTPGRVYKGKRMAGHMGMERVTVQNLEVVEIRAGENLILVKGAIPGANGGLVVLRSAAKASAAKGGK